MFARAFTVVSIVALAALGCRTSRATGTQEGLLASAEAPSSSPPPLMQTPDVAALVAKVSPAVVNITATREVRAPRGMVDPFEFFFGQRPHGRPNQSFERRALGSGFIIDDKGHVATNAHVVEDASKVRVTLADEREFDATVKGRDERLDVAVLELEGAKDLPRAALGSTDQVRVGDYVVAIGNPFGLGNTVTMGIVSAKSRELGAGPYDDFIQTDASINPGNSGGPLFNVKGEVVGINTAINPAGQGIGFASPIDALKEVIPELLAKGSVTRGRLGVAIQQVDVPIAKALGLDKPRGALIGEVEPDSPAAKAGLKPGEVILTLDGSPIEHARDLPRLVARHAPGTKVTVEVYGTNHEKRNLAVTLDTLPDERAPKPVTTPPSPPAGRPEFGLELGDDARQGVVVRGVDPSSPAAAALQPDDVILEVNGKPVRTAQEAAVELRASAGDRAALLRVKRDGETRFLALERK